jgi:hypothetical protein
LATRQALGVDAPSPSARTGGEGRSFGSFFSLTNPPCRSIADTEMTEVLMEVDLQCMYSIAVPCCSRTCGEGCLSAGFSTSQIHHVKSIADAKMTEALMEVDLCELLCILHRLKMGFWQIWSIIADAEMAEALPELEIQYMYSIACYLLA